MAVGDSARDQLSSGPVPVGAQSWRLLGCGVYLLWPPGQGSPSLPPWDCRALLLRLAAACSKLTGGWMGAGIGNRLSLGMSTPRTQKLSSVGPRGAGFLQGPSGLGTVAWTLMPMLQVPFPWELPCSREQLGCVTQRRCP